MNVLLIVIMAIAVLVLIALYVAYYVKEHEATVVGVLKTGVLATIGDYGRIVYVNDEPGQKKPVVGDTVVIRHPFCLNLKRRKSKNESRLPDDYIMLRGYQSSSQSEILRESIGSAVLVKSITFARWIAKQGDRDIIIETDDDAHKMGDVITYIPSNIRFERFYYV